MQHGKSGHWLQIQTLYTSGCEVWVWPQCTYVQYSWDNARGRSCIPLTLIQKGQHHGFLTVVTYCHPLPMSQVCYVQAEPAAEV